MDEFDPLFVEKSYYVAPDVKKGTRYDTRQGI